MVRLHFLETLCRFYFYDILLVFVSFRQAYCSENFLNTLIFFFSRKLYASISVHILDPLFVLLMILFRHFFISSFYHCTVRVWSRFLICIILNHYKNLLFMFSELLFHYFFKPTFSLNSSFFIAPTASFLVIKQK